MIYLAHFLTTKYKTMKKIILTSLLFSLATLVNATPTGITLSGSHNIDENLDIGKTIGTASSSGGSGTHTYTVQDSNTFSFNVGKVFFGAGNTNNFIVKDINDATHTIAIINFNSTTSVDDPATKLADAINTYNTANNSVVSAEAVNATNDGGTVRLTSWPANLDGAELIGFDTSGKIVITITSTGNDKIIPTPTADFFSIDATTGVLKSEIVFDFEVKSTYTIVIRATDDNGSYAKTFTIDIINDLTDGLMLSSEVVAEHNAIGTTVGILATDGGTGPYSYTVSNANTPNKNFSFDVGAVNNGPNGDNTFIVRAIDGVTEINIANYNYTYQYFENNFNNPAAKLSREINNNRLTNGTGFSAEFTDVTDVTGSFTGIVTLTDWPDFYDGAELIGTDPNSANNYITIISTDKTLPNYAPFSIKDDKLITAAVLDKATQSSYTITISSTDSTGTVISKNFKINVAEGPSGTVTGITISKDTITNQAADGATVGFLLTNATDTGRAYALVDNTATFSISGNKLTANNPNTLQTGTISVSISTLNGDNTIFTQSLTITVTNDPAFSLDVDGNGSFTASNDGLIIFKYLLNSNANNLHTTISSNAMEGRRETPQLRAYLDDTGDILDVDGNGSFTASNDGLIIFKYLLNSNANNLHTTVSSNAPETRKTTSQLRAYLDPYSE